MKNSKKEFAQEKQIAASIVSIKSQREGLEKLSAEYFDYAKRAAQLGQDEYTNELLESIVQLEDFAENLKFLELKIETAVISAQTMKEMRELPSILKFVGNIICKGPNFKKLGSEMSETLAGLKTFNDQLREFRVGLSRGTDSTYAKLFGKKDEKDPKYEERLAAKKRALEASIVMNSDAPAPVAAGNAVADTQNAASVDEIAAMLDDVRSGK